MKESSCFAAVWDRVSGDDWSLMADAARLRARVLRRDFVETGMWEGEGPGTIVAKAFKKNLIPRCETYECYRKQS